QADQVVYQVEKLLKDNADRLAETDRAPVQAAVARIKDVMNRDDVQAIRRAVEDLQAASQAMAQHMQGRRAASAAPSGDGRDGQGKEDVIDAGLEGTKEAVPNNRSMGGLAEGRGPRGVALRPVDRGSRKSPCRARLAVGLGETKSGGAT